MCNKINDVVFDNNLYFYTILKILVQCKFTDSQLICFQSLLNKIKNNGSDRLNLNNQLSSYRDTLRSNTKKSNYDELTSLIERNSTMWFYVVNVGIELLLFKDLILAEAKAYTNAKQQMLEKIDKLSIEYDTKNLSLPYGQRVLSSLLCFALTNIERESEFLLTSSNQRIKSVHQHVLQLANAYHINCNNMFLLIVNESVNQSIRSTAGSSYEERVEATLRPIADDLLSHLHDENIQAMEYDFIFTIKGKKVGVSAKRTLRERYKQNHENVANLNVDAVFLITLGTDLNQDKINSILQKDKYYIIVASEIYNASEFMQQNTRILSSEDLTRKTLEEVLSKW